MQAQQLPHNDYAETCAIGCLLESYSPDMLLSELVPEDFYSAANRIIFAAARDVAAAGAPVGIFTITDRLRADGNLEKVGGPAYLERCANSVVSIAQVEGAVWGVRDAALLRGGYLVAVNAAREFANQSANAGEVIGEVQSKLLAITSRNKEAQASPVRELMHATVEQVESMRGRVGISGTPTGLRMLDYWTGGLQRGELAILAARPSMGKTSLMMAIATHAALAGTRTYVFSLEMNKMQLGLRMVCSEAEVDSHRVRTGRADDGERVRLASAAARLSDARMLINDSATDLNEIIATAKREHQFGPLGLVCIDYLGLIYTKFTRGESRDREIGMITRQLKALAKELDCPVLCLSQLSRINEAQKVKRPTLNALRDSGNIEQDADTVIFIHSDDYYSREAAGEQAQEWQSEIIIEKQRNGPTADIPVRFKRQFTRFYEVDTRQPAAPPAVPDWYVNN
mgnify:FL=1